MESFSNFYKHQDQKIVDMHMSVLANGIICMKSLLRDFAALVVIFYSIILLQLYSVQHWRSAATCAAALIICKVISLNRRHVRLWRILNSKHKWELSLQVSSFCQPIIIHHTLYTAGKVKIAGNKSSGFSVELLLLLFIYSLPRQPDNTCIL